MSDPTALWLHGTREWLRFFVGLAIWLLPGIAAADRWMPGRLRWLWAPLWSFSLLALAAILLDFGVALKVTSRSTFVLAFGIALLAGRPRWMSWVRRRPVFKSHLDPPVRPVEGAAAIAAFLVVALLAFIPHIPGPDASGPIDAGANLAARVDRAISGDFYAYPMHVDEYYHMAQMAQVERTGRVNPPAPYTGESTSTGFFSVDGFRGEHGFEVGVTQLHLATAAPFGMLFLALPALTSGLLAVYVWLALRPAPGATASAALVGIFHTTDLFMGPGFLVPSALALPWLLAVLTVVTKARGPARLLGLLLFITSVFFLHLVLGTLALAVGVVAALLAPGRVRDRLGLVAMVLLPLLWIGPAAGHDIASAINTSIELPFQPRYFRIPGWAILLAAGGGVFGAWFTVARWTWPHRVITILAVGLVSTLAISIAVGEASDATYWRLVHALFLTIACLAGLGVGLACRWVGKHWPFRFAAVAGGAVACCAVALLLLPALQAHEREPYYLLQDKSSWASAATMRSSGAGPGDVYLGDPWQAPVFNAFTGAHPWAVLYPGAPPVHGADYEYYLNSGGANTTWLSERHITYVVSGPPPNAPFDNLGNGVYKLRL